MSTKSKHVLAASFIVLFVCIPAALATLIFNDGGIHTIDFAVNEEVEVYDSPEGDPTTVNLVTGGSIEHRLRIFNNSQANVSEGYIKWDLYAYDNSQVTFSGGTLDAGLYGFQNSYIAFSGGLINDLRAYDNSQIDFTGGLIAVDMRAGWHEFGPHTGTISISGSGFNYPFGEITVSSGSLTGTLANDDSIDNDFYIYDNASIILVPEPSPTPVEQIEMIIAEKLNLIDQINIVLEKEQQVIESLASSEYGDLTKVARQKIDSAIKQQEKSIKALEKSIENLEDSLLLLCYDLEL